MIFPTQSTQHFHGFAWAPLHCFPGGLCSFSKGFLKINDQTAVRSVGCGVPPSTNISAQLELVPPQNARGCEQRQPESSSHRTPAAFQRICEMSFLRAGRDTSQPFVWNMKEHSRCFEQVVIKIADITVRVCSKPVRRYGIPKIISLPLAALSACSGLCEGLKLQKPAQEWLQGWGCSHCLTQQAAF